MKNKTIVVWFSCGAASAVAAKMTIDLYGADNTIRIVNNPIKEEHEDNQRQASHRHRLGQRTGTKSSGQSTWTKLPTWLDKAEDKVEDKSDDE